MAEPASVLHELGDATRLRVFVSLLGGRKNVSQIVSELSLAQPQVSYHLRKLKEAGLAVEERDGRWVWYEANWETGDSKLREFLDVMAGWSGLVTLPAKKPTGRSAGTKRARATRVSASKKAPRAGGKGPKKATARAKAAKKPTPRAKASAAARRGVAKAKEGARGAGGRSTKAKASRGRAPKAAASRKPTGKPGAGARKSRVKPRGAGVMRPAKVRKIPIVMTPDPDEPEERPIVERPVRTTSDMDDFLL